MAEQNNITEKGGISVETAHIFPIIKRWLYSEKDIFLREIVSNAADAITKMKRLCSLGQAECDDAYRITVRVDKTAGTLSVEDNGLGMTADELRRYICQIALSGALEFIQKYEGGNEENKENSGIIGHFGLGFYSSFMVADRVEIDTLSYTGGEAVHWSCSEDGSYEISASERTERGTAVIMHIADDETEYLDTAKIRSMLEKYCAFMPYEIYLESADDKDAKDEPKPINDTTPLWLKKPSECTDEEYREFYHKVFSDFNDPLFSIHINADYPLNFKGILYFPKLRSEYDSLEGQVKLYYNQVFVADNVKEIMPEYLIMLRGVIDCPELPLNVSRSYLQNNTYVSRVSAHIVKKIADKVNALCNTDRENYEKIWNDIRIFIEYAAVRDRKFFDRVKDSVLLRLTDDSCVTIEEYFGGKTAENEGAENGNENDSVADSVAANKNDGEKAGGNETAAAANETRTVFYTNDPAQQSQYISLYTSQGIKVAVLDHLVDAQFIQSAETIYEKLRFVRVDADVSKLTEDTAAAENKDVADLFRRVTGNEKLEVRFESFKASDAPALLNLNEDQRRMDDFMKAYAFMTKSEAAAPMAPQSLILNTASPLYAHLGEVVSLGDSERAEFIAGYIWRLSLMAHRRLEAEELNAFLSDSYKLLGNY